MFLVQAGSAHTLAHAQPVSTPPSNPQNQKGERIISGDVGTLLFYERPLMTSENHREYLKELESLLKLEGLNPYETSLIYQNMAVCRYELGNLDDAIRSFERAIEVGGLRADEVKMMKVNMARLHVANGVYERGAEIAEDVALNFESIDDDIAELPMLAWIEAEKYNKALPWAESWFENATPKTRRHYEILGFLYSHLGLNEKHIDITRTMVGIWPEEVTLWKTWSVLLTQSGLEKEAFEVWKQMYELGYIDEERELIQLAELYGSFDAPFWGANLLLKELATKRVGKTDATYRALGGLWYQAREYEKAELAYSKIEHHGYRQLVATSNQGEHRIFDDYYQSWADAAGKVGRCERAEEVLPSVEAMGYDGAKAWVLVGICHYGLAMKLPAKGCYSQTNDSDETRWQTQKAALNAFGNVKVQHREYPNAQNWIKVIKAQQRLEEGRHCECGPSLEKELCYIKIRQAYDAQVFTHKFELEETCVPHKAGFDRLYRTTTGGSR